MDNVVCTGCGLSKPQKDFSKDSRSKTGYKRRCKLCWNEYFRQYYRNKPDKYETHKEYVKKNDSEYKSAVKQYSITQEKLNELIDKYDGLCHTCRKNKASCVDHDHACCPGKGSCGRCVRGVLCSQCNTALGMVRDDPQTLTTMVKYLTDWR